MVDMSLCTNEDCPKGADCYRSTQHHTIGYGQSLSPFGWYVEDHEVCCDYFMEIEGKEVKQGMNDTNVFGVPCTSKAQFFTSLGAMFAQYDEGKIKTEDLNQAILLACGQFYSTDVVMIAEYRKLSLETQTKHLTSGDHVPDGYYESLDAAGPYLYSWKCKDDDKIRLIKEARRVTGCGLKEAKVFVEERILVS